MKTDAEYLKDILPKLKEPMPYKWRVQSFSEYKPEATCVAFVDARDVQDRLDEVCLYGWDRDHKELKNHIYAGIGIWMPSGKIQWRWDCGVESNTEAEKGESSDSFKRAAVNWGVGRFLYSLETVTIRADKKKVKGQPSPHAVDDNGKWLSASSLTEYINNLKNNDKGDAILEIAKVFLFDAKDAKSINQFYRENAEEIESSPDRDEIIAECGKAKERLMGK